MASGPCAERDILDLADLAIIDLPFLAVLEIFGEVREDQFPMSFFVRFVDLKPVEAAHIPDDQVNSQDAVAIGRPADAVAQANLLHVEGVVARQAFRDLEIRFTVCFFCRQLPTMG